MKRVSILIVLSLCVTGLSAQRPRARKEARDHEAKNLRTAIKMCDIAQVKGAVRKLKLKEFEYEKMKKILEDAQEVVDDVKEEKASAPFYTDSRDLSAVVGGTFWVSICGALIYRARSSTSRALFGILMVPSLNTIFNGIRGGNQKADIELLNGISYFLNNEQEALELKEEDLQQ